MTIAYCKHFIDKTARRVFSKYMHYSSSNCRQTTPAQRDTAWLTAKSEADRAGVLWITVHGCTNSDIAPANVVQMVIESEFQSIRDSMTVAVNGFSNGIHEGVTRLFCDFHWVLNFLMWATEVCRPIARVSNMFKQIAFHNSHTVFGGVSRMLEPYFNTCTGALLWWKTTESNDQV